MARGQLEAPWGCNHALKRRECYTNTGPIRKTLVWEQEILVRFQILPGTCYGPLHRVLFQPSTFVVCGLWNVDSGKWFPGLQVCNMKSLWLSDSWLGDFGPTMLWNRLDLHWLFWLSFLSIFFTLQNVPIWTIIVVILRSTNVCPLYVGWIRCKLILTVGDQWGTWGHCFSLTKLLGILVGVKRVKFLVHLTRRLPWALNMKCLEIKDEKQFCLAFLALNKRYCIN